MDEVMQVPNLFSGLSKALVNSDHDEQKPETSIGLLGCLNLRYHV